MKSGIYKITNTVNGKVYVGSAVDLPRRIRMHRWRLRNGRHVNPKLQAAWDKYGLEAFVFEVLFICTPEHLLDYEQRCIDGFDSVNNGYNICPTAGSTMKGRKFTPEHKARLSAANKGQINPHRGIPRSAETKEKIAAANKGKPNPYKGVPRTPETRARISAARLRPKALQSQLQTVDCYSGTELH